MCPYGTGPTQGRDNGTGLDQLIDGVFNQDRFLQLLRNFVAFDQSADGLAKRIAKPHQYFAVNKALGTTVEAVKSHGKAGVVWHTQGSGKSMEMELYTHYVQRHPALKNPTVVVVTDRTELDGQLFGAFSKSLLLPESPVQITTRSELRRRAHRTGHRRHHLHYAPEVRALGGGDARPVRRTRSSPIDATSSSSSTRRIAATTTTSTATPGTSRTPCPAQP